MEHELKTNEEHYRDGVMLVLAGYQLIEALLKTYLNNYFTIVKHIVPEELHFGFDGKDYENAALGTLVKVFSKVCGDSSLVSDLKSEISHRDHIAHKATLVIFQKEPLPAKEFIELSNQLAVHSQKTTELLGRLHEAHNKLIENYAQ